MSKNWRRLLVLDEQLHLRKLEFLTAYYFFYAKAAEAPFRLLSTKFIE